MSGHSRPGSRPRSALPLLVVLLAIIVAAIWALRAYQDRLSSQGQSPPTGRRVIAKVHFACTRDGQPRMMAAARRVPSGQGAGAAALGEMTTGGLPPGCSRPLPQGTRVLGVRVADGVATVDFSSELVSRFAGGADNEGIVVYAIVNTLASLPGVEGVHILVEGKPIESIGGHIDVSGTLRADDELVVPGVAAPDASAP